MSKARGAQPVAASGAGEPPARLDSLTGVRAFGALVVFAGHAIPALEGSRLQGLERLLHPGVAGVSWFFVLSGFLLAWSGSTALGTGRFYALRAARIWPAHLAVLVVLLAMMAADGERLDPITWLTSGLLVQAWLPSADQYFGLNGVAWSLSCEVFFYALSPWLLPLLAGLGSRARRWAMVAAWSGIVALAVAFPHPDDTFESRQAWASYIFPPSRLLEYVLGALLAHSVIAGGWRRARIMPAVGGMVVAFLIAGVLPLSFAVAAVCVVPFMTLLAALVHADVDGRRSPVRHPALLTLGRWAYTFYLVHALVLYEVGERTGAVGGPTRRAVIVVAVAFVISLVLAACLHAVVERPIEQRIRRLVDHRGSLPAKAPLPPADASARAGHIG